MIDAILSFRFNNLLGVLLYWLPLAFCIMGYTMRTAKNYMHDRQSRDNPDSHYYSPTDTIGSLIGRAVVTVVPIGNIWAAMFDLSPEIFRSLFQWLDKVFNRPLVPDTESAQAKRQARK